MDKIDPSSSGGNLGGQSQGRPQLNLDPSDLLDVECNECGNNTFIKVHFMKKVSEVVSPNGEEQLVPVPSFQCSECGHMNERFRSFDKE